MNDATRPGPITIGGVTFDWGSRTFVMGIVNVTPDSFSGDGLLRQHSRTEVAGVNAGRESATAQAASPVLAALDALGAVVDAAAPARAVTAARRMVEEGADIIDVGGESTRPGHVPVGSDEEAGRVVPVVAAIHAALPGVPISIDTMKPDVAAAALDAGAALLNDVWGVAEDDAMARLAAQRGVPLVIMHNRAVAQYDDVIGEVAADLEAAIERAARAGLPRERIIVDPGFGFGKTLDHNLAVMRGLASLRTLGCPVLLGTSRKSTLGRLLGGLPADQRLEATLATTVLAIASGVDIVRVHDVEANVRAARVADAIVRGAAG